MSTQTIFLDLVILINSLQFQLLPLYRTHQQLWLELQLSNLFHFNGLHQSTMVDQQSVATKFIGIKEQATGNSRFIPLALLVLEEAWLLESLTSSR